MLDAADLAHTISECSTLEDAVRCYEQTMVPRALIVAQGADQGLPMVISPDAATSVPAFLRATMSAEPA